MDRWYALQVTTGAEGDVKTRLDRLTYPAMLPMKIMRERRDGRWRDETKVMLPGYLFVQAAMTAADWHRDRKSTRLNSSHSDRSRMPSSA